MFEQNNNIGYVLKPHVFWNRLHPEYGKFNPYEKKKDGDYVSLYLKLISGQYLIENSQLQPASGLNNTYYRTLNDVLRTTSTFIEVEIVGIPCDCAKEKTKTFNKNALNPIWNEEFTFHVSSLKPFGCTIASLSRISICFIDYFPGFGIYQVYSRR
jgi:phosphatidylinositol phospholipase C epsilon